MAEIMLDTDIGLVRRAQAGDASAFGDLVELHQRAVYGIVSRMVPRDEVDDLVQEAFVAAWRSIGRFRGDAKFSTWLHTIAVNTTLKRVREMKRKYAVSLDDGLYEVASSERLPDERNEEVRRAVDALPEKQRIVVVMHYFEQYSCEEIAAVLRCSVGTVWSRLHYACKKLHLELEGAL
ncbi:MAG: RNA polymerase sigma factor [Armatimonadota bacterium]